MKRLLISAPIAAAVVAAAVLLGANVLGGQGGGSGDGEYGTLYIDAVPDADNTTTGFGTVEVCRDTDDEGGPLEVGDALSIDVVIGGANDLAAPYWILYYNQDVLKVTARDRVSWKMGSGGLEISDPLPDTDGAFATTYGQASGVDGDGVLLRVTLEAIANGSSDLKLCTVAGDCPNMADSRGTDHFYPKVLVHDPPGEVRVVVGGACPPATPAAIEPRPTPPPTEAVATPSIPAGLERWLRLRQEEAAKPRFEGVVNGIRLYPTDAEPAVQRKDACTGSGGQGAEDVPMSAVAGTPMEIVPTYLPAGAEEIHDVFGPTVCKGVLVHVERRWVIRDKGANVVIYRWQGEHATPIDAPAERVSAATVGGKPAVVVKPLVEGYDYAAVYLAEDFGITTVVGDGLSLEETIKIAEGLK